ncbi:MAG: tetratricopeptide repeat protein, partial [Syntrophothermus sp.]
MNPLSKIAAFLKNLFKKKKEDAPAVPQTEQQKIKKLKESYQFYYNEGLSHLKAGDNAKAIEAFTRAIELKGNLKEAYCNRGAALYQTGRETEALSDLMKAVEIDPEYEKAYYNLAAIKIASGDKSGAIEDYSAILEIDPWNARIYFERAALKAQTGDKEGAKTDFAQSLQLDPAYAEKFINESDSPVKNDDARDQQELSASELTGNSQGPQEQFPAVLAEISDDTI